MSISASEIEKLGEKLQKKVWKHNRESLTKDGRKTMSIMEMGRLLGLKKTESMGWKALKNHLCHTYMSFILSELTDEEMSHFILD